MKIIKDIEYTHIAEIYGFRCYYNINTNEVLGTTWLNELLILIFISIDLSLSVNDGFSITLIKEI